MSDDEEETGPRRKPIKPEYAFGTPIRQNIAFSDFAHLGPDALSFALSLAAHTDGLGSLKNEPKKSPEKKKHVKREKKLPPGIRPSATKARGDEAEAENAPQRKEALEPCTRPECRDVVQKIIDTQFANEIEREDIIRVCEECMLEIEDVERESAELETKAKAVNQDGAALEENLQLLMEKLEKFEKRLAAQVQEKDELNNKAMSLEMERQRLQRRSKEVESALSEALWSGRATVAVKENKGPTMFIRHPTEQEILNSDPLTVTISYSKLVRDDVMDFVERPKTVATVPHHLLLDKSAMAPLTAVARTNYEAFGETDLIKTNESGKMNSKTASDHSSGVRQMTMSPISKERTLPAVRHRGGYNPLDDSRSRSVKSRSSRRNQSDGTTVTSTSSWTHLDPVLYQERARTSWGREKKLGKIRVRNDPPGYKRAMLTSKGHPGIFNMDALDEESMRDIESEVAAGFNFNRTV